MAPCGVSASGVLAVRSQSRSCSSAVLCGLALFLCFHVSRPTRSRRPWLRSFPNATPRDLAQAARDFNRRFPEASAGLSHDGADRRAERRAVAELIGDADAMLLATVFKETAQRIQPLLPAARAQGNHRWSRAIQRWVGTAAGAANDCLLMMIARYAELSSLTAEKDASARVGRRVGSTLHPQLAPWIRARAYWQNRGESNLISLLALICPSRIAA